MCYSLGSASDSRKKTRKIPNKKSRLSSAAPSAVAMATATGFSSRAALKNARPTSRLFATLCSRGQPTHNAAARPSPPLDLTVALALTPSLAVRCSLRRTDSEEGFPGNAHAAGRTCHLSPVRFFSSSQAFDF